MHRVFHRGLAAAAVAALLPGAEAMAHGFAGDRFFPATILTDDPFVADEMSLPTVTLNPTQSDGSREFDIGTDLSMLITPKWDFTLSNDWAHTRIPGMSTQTGLTGLTTGTQYQLFINAEHEAMALAALDVTWGNTGRIAAGAPAFTTLSPTFDFGKGFGDLPDSLPWLRPLALTGNISLDFPTEAETNGTPNPNNFILRLRGRIQHSVSAEPGQRPRSGAAVQPHDPACRIRADIAVQPRPKRHDHRDGATRGHLGRAIFPGRRGDDHSDQQSVGARDRRRRAAAFLSR